MKLKDYRYLNDLSSSEFGKRIGVSGRAVQMYEAGTRVPRPRVMVRILAETQGDVSPNDFYSVTWKEPKNCKFSTAFLG